MKWMWCLRENCNGANETEGVRRSICVGDAVVCNEQTMHQLHSTIITQSYYVYIQSTDTVRIYGVYYIDITIIRTEHLCWRHVP
jgi:hypothetical protein